MSFGKQSTNLTNGGAVAFTCCSVRIDARTQNSAVTSLLARSIPPKGRSIHLCNAYTLSLASHDAEYSRALNSADFNFPDGMPLIWIGKSLGIKSLDGRVYGPNLMLDAMDKGRETGVKHFLYGSTTQVLSRLKEELIGRFPGLLIVGCEAPPFGDVNSEVKKTLDRMLLESQPDVVWVGLGTPKQDFFVHEYRTRFPATFVGIGAAFDFLSGEKSQAPSWMQNIGLEWAFRLASEPRRLWRRYLIHNFIFILETFRHRPRILDDFKAEEVRD